METSIAPALAALAMALGGTAFAGVVALAVCGGVGWRRERRARALLETRVQRLDADLRALSATHAGMGDRLMGLESQTRRVVECQTQLEMKSPATHHYRHAIALAERGASTEELVSHCGLARGEAELMQRIHRAGSGDGLGANPPSP